MWIDGHADACSGKGNGKVALLNGHDYRRSLHDGRQAVFAQENALFNTFDRERTTQRAMALIADPPASVSKAA